MSEAAKIGIEEEQSVHIATPSTASMRTESPFTPIAEPLDSVVAKICEELGVQFRSIEMDGIFGVRDMIFELFRHGDISHYHHLHNVEHLAGVVLEAPELRAFLHQQLQEKFACNPHKEEEVDQVLAEDFSAMLKLAMSLHDFGKILPQIQKVINLRRKPTKEEDAMIQRHTASEALFEEIGITRENFPIVLLVALYHHFPEYAGADPRKEKEFHIENPDMELEKVELRKHIPLFVSIAKIIDIIEAMTSQIRSYREPCIIRWFEKDTGPEFNRGDGKLHTSIEGELAKKCSENPELAVKILEIIHARWADNGELPGLGSQLVRTREQLRKFGHEEQFDRMVAQHNPTVAAPFQSGRLPRVAS